MHLLLKIQDARRCHGTPQDVVVNWQLLNKLWIKQFDKQGHRNHGNKNN